MTKALCLDFAQDNLVSDVPKSACHIEQGVTGLNGYGPFTDAYGVAIQVSKKKGCTKKIFVSSSNAASASSRIFCFDTCGATAENTLNTPTGITGIGVIRDVTFNARCDGFEFNNGGSTGTARVIASYSGGFVAAGNHNVNPLFVTQTFSSATPGSNFTGVTYYDKHIYLADYGNDLIVKLDSSWAQVLTFTDQDLIDDGYSPFGVKVVRIKKNCRLAVTFVPNDYIGNEQNYQNSVGFGYVDIFRTDGSFYRFANRGPLAIPFAAFNICLGCHNYIGVTNHGNGRINFFDEKCGRFLAPAYDEYGNILEIDGLYGVAPDPKKAVLYFAAAISDGQHGLFGRLTLVS